jgi:hypothetical protein
MEYREGFEWLLPLNDADFDLLRFDGQPRRASWKPVRMTRLTTTESGQLLRPTDFPACSGGDMLLLSGAARGELQAELERFGELLPLHCDDGEFWAYNVTRLVDALDEGDSQVLRATDTGAILMIRRHVFRPQLLGNAHIFKLVQMTWGLIYVTDEFTKIVAASGLAGLGFSPVWAGANAS